MTLLLFDDRHGDIAAQLLTEDYFDQSTRDVAKRALEYRREFHKAPGEAHIDDVFDTFLDPKNKERRRYQGILTGVLEQSKGLNGEYTASRVSEFMRRQTLKAAIVEAGQRYSEGGDGLLPDVEGILHKALKFKTPDLDVGRRLGDRRNIAQLMNPVMPDFFTGIPELDKRGFGLARKTLMMYIGIKGTGKSWWLCHLGRHALMQGGKILHVTLEMSEEQVVERYWRNFFALGKRDEKFERVTFDKDELGKLIGFNFAPGKHKWKLTDPDIRDYLENRMDKWGARLNNIIIKSFPSGSLTVPGLEAYLDGLELSERFVPDVILLDYPDLMDLDHRTLRESLGRLYVDFRGMLQRRNMAGCGPSQGNREGAEAKNLKATHVAEDWSKGFTVDMSVIYRQTEQEKENNLARLYVDKNRGDQDHFEILISQNYAQGQFCMDSVFMDKNRYWNKLKELTGDDDEK